MLREAYNKAKGALARQETKYIQRALDPEHCKENQRYINTASRLIYFFNNTTSRGELERMDDSLLLSPPFSLQKTVRNTDTTYTILRATESGAENDLQGESQGVAEPSEGSAMEVTYDANGSLKSIVYSHSPSDETPLTIKRNGDRQWEVNGFIASSISQIPKAKERYVQEQRELVTFWDEYYDSVVLNPKNPVDPDQLEWIYSNFKAQRESEKMKRIGGDYSRRDFLKDVGVVALGALLLAACGSLPQGEGKPASSFDTPPQSSDLQELLDANDVYHAPLLEEVEKAEYENLSPGAKEVLYAYLGSKAAADSLSTGWRKVVTPAFLKERGILTGENLAEVFEFKNANGGVRYFDKVSNRYIKLSPVGSVDERYLRLAYQDTIKGWRAIGMPEELVTQVQWAEGFTIDGKTYSMMVTPNVGNNVEGFVSMLRNNKKINGEQKVLALLDEYYTKVLFPMNAAGVIQQDLNFKNITVLTQADGTVRFVPIDLAAHPKILEQGMVFQWQYEQLVERAARRKIAMPSFAEYLASHPDIGKKVTVFEALAKEGIFKTSVDVGSQCVHLYIPKTIMGENVDKAVVDNLIQQMKGQYGAQYEAMPQGEIFTLEVRMADGSVKPVAFMKTNSVGGKILPLGGKWGEALKLVKSGVKLASDALLVLWIASEVAEFTDPDYKAYIESAVAFPDTLVSTGRDKGIVFLDAMYDRLMLSKTNLSAKAMNLAQWTPLMKEMIGMDNKDALKLITEYGVPHPHIIGQIDEIVKHAVVPPAGSDMRFASPFPILIPGAEIPTTAYFSAFEGESKEKTIFFWAQVPNADGSVSTMPVSAFTKSEGAKDWTMTPIIDKPWNVQFTLNQDVNLVYTCGTASSNGSTFELECEDNR